ncbi:MAG: polyamine ABC transporter substrate-binding protein [Oceanospirillales bacterium]|uniref:Putrescine-binding periplasmic protein n=1 Tax=Marinobacterium halophilum TaxID=267374 RepID=A0A2P8ELD3_9GAMM|nr:polyamine ABC transporter substrate-binding protein [Marinobacterium halophilum]MBR9829298.1 polyamine ABC transporter substrate-binding protein [Oceanospirillales bacterium]PSL10269.1 putrescine transport system substrate-binding protein [Marinobacterium halophilum]
MNTLLKKFKHLLPALLLTGAAASSADELHVYNWSDYIAEDTLAGFEQQTGIKVIYDVYDANEIMEAKLLAGRSGYDLIFPTARPFAERHIKAGLYQPLDKSQLSGLDNLDPVLMNSLASIDAGNAHLIPYMWGSSGIGYNVTKVREILGDDMPTDTWRLLFDPEIVAKLADCGVTLMDDPTEVLVAANIYRGAAADDFSRDSIKAASATVSAVRPHVRYFHSSQYINDLANGDTCVAHGYSGDVLQARDRAAEADNGVEIAYVVPAEGALVWTDVMAIPADAPNPAAAHRFINYLLQPDVIAPITDYVAYANANLAATALVDAEIRNNPGIYPPAETRAKLLVTPTPSERQIRDLNRSWTRVKTGQ